MMRVDVPLPRMRRDLDIQFVPIDDEPSVLLTDPWAEDGYPWVLSDIAFAVLQLMNGKRSLRQIQASLRRFTGGLSMPIEQLQQLVMQFQSLILLEDDTYRVERVPVRQAYLESSTRAPAHAGVSYPDDADELRRYLTEVLALASPRQEHKNNAGSIVGVVSPHLDLRVEEEAYATTYEAVRGMDPERVILLGTGHDISDGLFSLTHKDYMTPLGAMPCDRDAMETLREAGGDLCSSHDLAHRNEHALEFQVPFLQEVLARPDTPIVPILCGSFYSNLQEAKRATDITGVSKFLDALRGLMTENTLVVAGVDLSHIGRKFGHDEPAVAMMDTVQAHDEVLLEALCAQDASGFWEEVQRTDNAYHVCGFSSLSVMMEVLPSYKGDVLRHDFWDEEETESAVSFASVVLRG